MMLKALASKLKHSERVLRYEYDALRLELFQGGMLIRLDSDDPKLTRFKQLQAYFKPYLRDSEYRHPRPFHVIA